MLRKGFDAQCLESSADSLQSYVVFGKFENPTVMRSSNDEFEFVPLPVQSSYLTSQAAKLT